MNTGVDAAILGSSDPVLSVDSYGSGQWLNFLPMTGVPGLIPLPWSAFTTLNIVAEDAEPIFGTNVPISILARTEITPDVVINQLVLRTTISWAAHDFISQTGIPVVEDKVSESILKKLKAPPGQTEIERGDRFIVYRSTRDILQLVNPLFTTNVHQAAVGEGGLQATGSVFVAPAPVGAFTLEAMRWVGGIDCSVRAYVTKFHPSIVHVFCPDRAMEIQIRSTPVVDPAGFWIPTFGFTGVGTGILVREIEFRSPFPAHPAGLASSAFLDTNLGVRWVDLGTVPAEPNQNKDPIALEAEAISQCMAISDRWGMGVMNLAWLVDPAEAVFGVENVREWTIAAEEVLNVDQLELVAVGRRGERRLASAPVEGGVLFAQVITAADETLQVRGAVSLAAASPRLFQRWITPVARVPMEAGLVPLAVLDGVLWVGDEGRVSQVRLPEQGAANGVSAPAVHHVAAANVPAGVARGLARRATVHRTAGGGRTVAVRDGDAIVVGLAGPLMPATEAAMQKATSAA